MDKKTIIGFILIGTVLIWFSWLNRPTPEAIDAAKRKNDSIAKVEMAKQQALNNEVKADEAILDSTFNTDSAKQAQLDAKFGVFANRIVGTDELVTLENDLLELKFSTKGGRLYEARLKQYSTYDSLPLILFSGSENDYGFLFKTQGRVINTSDLYFEPKISGNALTMRLDLSNGNYFDLNYTLDPESYMLKMDIVQNGMANILPSSTNDLDMYWNQTLRRQEKGRVFEERYSGIYYKFAVDDVENLSESSNDKKEISNALKWIAFKNQFFSSALIADKTYNWTTLESIVMHESDTHLKKLQSSAVIDYNIQEKNPAGFRFFLGPNSYPLLKSYNTDNANLDLDKLVPLGPSVFRWVNTWLVIPLFTFFGKFFTNYGLIILLMTIVIKMILAPLTFKSYMSTARMRVLRPQVEEITAKFPGQDKAMDRQRATMELYNKAGINPMSGCLPMLLQMPILFAMFTFFPSSIELRGESFLWAHDLSSYDAIFTWDAYIPIITPYFGNHISLFCLLMTVTNLVYTKINMENAAGGQQMPGMKLMMYVMPLMFLFIFNNYASGLSYYYFISTLITIIQTYIFRQCINEQKVLAKLEENKKKPRKKSGFMARLEEAQRKQQAVVKAQQEKQNKKKK